ncbi:MAG: hypothetical protein V1915_00355 [Candidatus Bathyarchaeota archaeon]
MDFIRKLRADPTTLEVLGDGRQQKSYLLVGDCVDAMRFGVTHAPDPVNLLNLGGPDQITVDRIARILLDEMRLPHTTIRYTGGARGWAGDVPEMSLSTQKLAALGWTPHHTSEDAIRKTCQILLQEL